jgi:hypothetical protein
VRAAKRQPERGSGHRDTERHSCSQRDPGRQRDPGPKRQRRAVGELIERPGDAPGFLLRAG